MKAHLVVSLAVAAALSVPVFADSVPQTQDLTQAFVSNGVTISGLRVTEVGGIVVIRGKANDAEQAETALTVAHTLGYARVANLVQVVALPDDMAIERRAERELMLHRGLEGSHLRIASRNGVVTLGGSVAYEIQKDAAIALIRNIDGVRSVRVDFQ